MKKKIGIVTQIRVFNYGTRLQAYAMQEIFRSRGFFTEIFVLERYCGLKALIRCHVKTIRDVFNRNARYRFYVKCHYDNTLNDGMVKKLIKRLGAIDLLNKKLNYTVHSSEKELTTYTSKFHAVVCGSDQMWRPVNNDLQLKMLRYVSPNIRKISYAPSLGVNIIPEDTKPFIREALEDFYCISVRETNGAELLRPLTDKPVYVVLDPTLLVGRKVWDKVLKYKDELANEDYCLCYFLGTNPDHRKIAREVSDELHLTVYNFPHFKEYNTADEKLAGVQLFDISPSEFVGLISKAKFVITDSLHCTIFSIMYHIPFITLQRYDDNDALSTNCRVFSLLSQFGLESRIFTAGRKVEDYITDFINFENVESILNLKRMESNAYLDKALKNL